MLHRRRVSKLLQHNRVSSFCNLPKQLYCTFGGGGGKRDITLLFIHESSDCVLLMLLENVVGCWSWVLIPRKSAKLWNKFDMWPNGGTSWSFMWCHFLMFGWEELLLLERRVITKKGRLTWMSTVNEAESGYNVYKTYFHQSLCLFLWVLFQLSAQIKSLWNNRLLNMSLNAPFKSIILQLSLEMGWKKFFQAHQSVQRALVSSCQEKKNTVHF